MGRVVLVAVIAALALGAGFGVSRVLYGTNRSVPAPVIDLDNLPPPADSPPSAAEVDGGGIVVPTPTLLPPAGTAPATSRTPNPPDPGPARTAPPAPPLDDAADDDAGELDD